MPPSDSATIITDETSRLHHRSRCWCDCFHNNVSTRARVDSGSTDQRRLGKEISGVSLWQAEGKHDISGNKPVPGGGGAADASEGLGGIFYPRVESRYPRRGAWQEHLVVEGVTCWRRNCR